LNKAENKLKRIVLLAYFILAIILLSFAFITFLVVGIDWVVILLVFLIS